MKTKTTTNEDDDDDENEDEDDDEQNRRLAAWTGVASSSAPHAQTLGSAFFLT